MTPQEMIDTKEDWITEEWLKSEGFEQDKIGAGSFPWRKNIYGDVWAVVVTNTDCGDISMSVFDRKNTLQYLKRRPSRLLKTELEKLIDSFKKLNNYENN